MTCCAVGRQRQTHVLKAGPYSLKNKQQREGGPGGDLHGSLSADPQRSGFCRRHWSMISVFSPPPEEEYEFIIQPGTGRCALPLLSSISRVARGFLCCMVDILLNTSFLDDMGDHSKSKKPPFLLTIQRGLLSISVFDFYAITGVYSPGSIS